MRQLRQQKEAEAKKTIVTGKGKIEDSDYNDFVKWTGKTKGGRSVVIKIYNAINLENFDWSLADKDEVSCSINIHRML